jgi:acetolactate synthase-1/2/3 large subunit
VVEFYKSVDLLIVAGGRMRGHETADMSLALPQRKVQIDIDPRAQGRTYASEFFLSADAGATLDRLADAIKGKIKVDKGLAGDIAMLKERTTENYRRAQAPYDGFPAILRKAMPKDAIWGAM